MIDAEGFRPNVGIIIQNWAGQLLWARRVGGQDAWQFPQGGINDGESAESALYRELHEEVGLNRKDVKLLAATRGWLRYRLPPRFVRKQQPLCIGQKQRWFLLELTAPENRLNLALHGKPEFDRYQWVSYWYPINQVVAFKRDVYRKALRELSPVHARLEEERLDVEEAPC